MMMCARVVLFLVLAVMLAGCPSSETTTTVAPPVSMGKEALYRQGHQLYLLQQTDSAIVVLRRAAAMDSAYTDPLLDLGTLFYELAQKERGEQRAKYLKSSRTYFARVDRLGAADSPVYERLCEIAVALEDDQGFVTYARKNAARYPYDRQYYNLGVACFNAADYNAVIKTQKEALAKFPESSYIAGFYRQMGRAYQKLDRDQTATKTFVAGIQAAENRIAALRRSGSVQQDDLRRLRDDRVGMLTALRMIYRTYKESEKLQQVEQQLKAAGSLE